ncbi:hypothetical protein FOL75_04885 [Bacillus thuringiensis]|uniref:hypothetical protein n=1 Tax=Bacillus thuringiensis TaxID=1428 RepID=UPI002853D1C2|nr:hypothetical protein [Bacillus thuringiensis]MDR5021404.1 hypothetical protein [Bacillus thuringiensis]
MTGYVDNLNSPGSGENQGLEQPIVEVKKPKLQKPPTFKKMESATKQILEARGIGYYDWLHEMHEKLVQETLLANVDSIGLLVKS